VTTPILLDTCALLWIAQGDPLADDALRALDESWAADLALSVSPISAWEVGLLVSRGRLALTMDTDRWWSQAMTRIGLLLAPMPPALLIASTLLPGLPPTDPADRIVAATARDQGLRLMTRDRRLLDYAEAGHLESIAC
jgi:PIN domain nuclease of toxin-antitoxin system